MSNEESSVLLYHGSKSGLQGAISPSSRARCDFGRGFYMGTEPTQPLTLICDYPDSVLYTVRLDLAGLVVKHLDADIAWAMTIAYNRGKLERVRGSKLYGTYASQLDGVDLAVGLIANDRMFVVLDRFFSGTITDVALVECLKALRLGEQYVALTQKACSQVHILSERRLTPDEQDDLQEKSMRQRSEGIARAEDICRRYRREGRFFDEILAEEAGRVR